MTEEGQRHRATTSRQIHAGKAHIAMLQRDVFLVFLVVVGNIEQGWFARLCRYLNPSDAAPVPGAIDLAILVVAVDQIANEELAGVGIEDGGVRSIRIDCCFYAFDALGRVHGLRLPSRAALRCCRRRSSTSSITVDQHLDVIGRVYVPCNAVIVESNVDLILVVAGRYLLSSSAKPGGSEW